MHSTAKPHSISEGSLKKKGAITFLFTIRKDDPRKPLCKERKEKTRCYRYTQRIKRALSRDNPYY